MDEIQKWLRGIGKDYSIDELKNLRKLDLWDKQLQSIPESIGKLGNLQWLHLGNNQLRSLPESLRDLKNLRDLYLHINQLQTLPESISELKNLILLYLAGNQLQSLPYSTRKLKQTKIYIEDLWISKDILKFLQINIITNNSAIDTLLQPISELL